jgi:hypothetical protein
MWHRVEVVLTDVSEERIASIFRVKGKIRKSAREASVRDVSQISFKLDMGGFISLCLDILIYVSIIKPRFHMFINGLLRVSDNRSVEVQCKRLPPTLPGKSNLRLD